MHVAEAFDSFVKSTLYIGAQVELLKKYGLDEKLNYEGIDVQTIELCDTAFYEARGAHLIK